MNFPHHLLVLSFAILGLALCYLEIFLPGMVAGILGIASLAVSVIETYKFDGALPALLVLVGEILLSVVGLLVWARFFPKTRIGRHMILQTFSPPPSTVQEQRLTTGQEGQALTELRPAGTAEFDGKRYDVVAESTFIPVGEAVKIMRIDKYRVVVRQSVVPTPTPTAPTLYA